MGWPISQDYNEAIQNPRTSFAEPELKGGEVVPGPLGLPLPRSGNFADVYQMIGSDGRKWAIKCFTRHVPGLQERYAKIDAHLLEAQLPFSVGFQFLEQGIRVRGQWYPILKMEWVEGITLNEFVRQYADKPIYLRALLGLWLKLTTRLRAANMAHADLQHGNVLLVPGATANKLNLKLIDYDGMWVPALAQSPSGEAGHPAYQHPLRLQERVYSADVDRFPHLVIACALRATALGGKKLWGAFDNGDNLLFREVDFAQPAQSKLLRTLWDMDDPTITNLLALLVLSAQRPLSDTPWVDELLVGEQTTAVSDGLLARAAKVMGVAQRQVRQPIPTAQLFVTTDQGNDFATLATAPLPKYMRKQKSKLPFVLSGMAVLALVVGAIGIAYALRGHKNAPEPNQPLAKKEHPEPETPKASPRATKVDARWLKIEPGPQMLGPLSLPEAVAVGGEQRVVRVFDKRSAGLALALSADGMQAVCAGRDRLSVTNLIGEDQATSFGAAEGPFSLAVISPDARYVVTVSKERDVCCWQVETQQRKWAWSFPDKVTALAITPDARRVAISGVGVGYYEWGLADNREARRHPQIQAQEMHFTLDGEKLLTRIGEQLEWWELDEPERKGSITPAFDVRCCAISANGKEIWAGGKSAEVKRWNATTFAPLPDYAHGRSNDVQGIVPLFRPTGFLFRYPNGVGLCANQTQAVVPEIVPVPLGTVATMVVTRDNSTALLGNDKGFAIVRLNDAVKTVVQKNEVPLRLRKTMTIDPLPQSVTYDPSGKYMVATYANKAIVGETATGRSLGTYSTALPIQAVGFTHDERLVITEGTGAAVRTNTWDWKNKTAGTAFALDEGDTLTKLRPIPNDTKPHFVLALSSKRGVLLYDTQTNQPVAKWPDAQGHIKLAVPTPDGQFVALAYANAPLKFWSVDAQETLRTMVGSEGVMAIEFTPDGKKLVGLWPLGRLCVWDAESGKIDVGVAHDVAGPLTGLRVVGPNLVQLQSERGPALVQLDPGKVLTWHNTPTVFQKQVALAAGKETFLSVNDGNLEVWSYSAKAFADLPEAEKVAPTNPDLLLVRDGPGTPLVGADYTATGKIVLATANGRLQRYSSDHLQLEHTATAPGEAEFRHLARSGSSVFTVGPKGDLRKWDLDRMEQVATFPIGNDPVVTTVKPDSELVFAALADGKMYTIDMTRKKGNPLAATVVPSPSSPTGRLVRPLVNAAYFGNATAAVVRWDTGMIGLWKPGEARIMKFLIDDGAKDQVAPPCLAPSPTGKYVVLGTKSGYIRVWDTNIDKKPRSEWAHRVEGKNDCITDVVMSTSGTHFLSRGVDGKIILWNVATLKHIKEYPSEPGPGRVCFAPDEKTFVVLTPGRIELWKVPDLTKE